MVVMVVDMRMSHSDLACQRASLPKGISALALAYVQHCQVAVGEFGIADVARQFDALWNCLGIFPRHVEHEQDAVAVVCATFMMACAFLKSEARVACGCTASSRRRQHVLQVLAETRRQFRNPALCLGILARQHGLARSHLSRAIAAESRYRFRTHLNGVRLLNAVVHLGDPTVAIKQVAGLAGYLATGELDRQLTRLIGMTPKVFRSLLAHGPSLQAADAWGRDARAG
jgi:transcriptional regulator GlxA family with amidase domain